jgi:hypothetical protein
LAREAQEAVGDALVFFSSCRVLYSALAVVEQAPGARHAHREKRVPPENLPERIALDGDGVAVAEKREREREVPSVHDVAAEDTAPSGW